MTEKTCVRSKAVWLIAYVVVAEVCHVKAYGMKVMTADPNSQAQNCMDKVVDKLTDKLSNRALKLWSRHRTNLESTTLRKAGGDSPLPLYQPTPPPAPSPGGQFKRQLFWPGAPRSGRPLAVPMNLKVAKQQAALLSECAAKYPLISTLTFGTAMLHLMYAIVAVYQKTPTGVLDYLIAPLLAVSVILGIYSTTYSLLETYYIPTALNEVGNDEKLVAKLMSILRSLSTMRVLARDSLWASLSLLLIADAILLFTVSVPGSVILLAGVAPIFISVYFFRTSFYPILQTSKKFLLHNRKGKDLSS